VDGDRLASLRRLGSKDAELSAGEACLVFRREVSGPSEWFNDDAYSDNLNPDSVAAFIDITYEAYRKEVGAQFGKAVPGIFTDEPNIASEHAPESQRRFLPWTDGLAEMFRKRRGYDLLGVLPWLFFEGEKAAKTRHDFWYTVSQRFTEAYSKQLGEWCEKNGLAFTGHFLNEQEMGTGIHRGGAIMPHYRYQQVPGIDMLTEQNREFLTIKQCTSVANQFGRRRVLSETYGCSGWEFTFEGQKWNGDWQYVLGVNLRCQHLALYSLRGCRKRDFPPAFNYNTTWWKYNGVVEDYFARVGRVLSEGSAVRDVLLLHPVATGWSMLGEGQASVEAVNDYAERLNDFVQALLATHYDFDFGDEQILSSDAQAANGQVTVGRARYKALVIPPETRTLLASTVRLLKAYLDGGGKMILVGEPPDWVEAAPADELRSLWRHPGVVHLADATGLSAALEQILPRRVSLVTSHGQQAARLLYMQRALDDGRTAYFIVNNDRFSGYPLEVALEGTGRLEEWDALTGAIRGIPAVKKDGRLHFNAGFGPAGSRLYVVDPRGTPARENQLDFRAGSWKEHPGETVRYIGPSTPFTRSDPNLLTLDVCQYRLGDGAWSGKMEVWRAQDEARKVLGMRPNYYNGLPQRYRWALQPHPRDGTLLELRFNFTVRDVPQNPVFLVLEAAERFTVQLNGKAAPMKVDGWYLDQAFHKIRLPGLQVGENSLVLSCAYTNYMEIEDCFLLGDFGVSLAREIISEPERLQFCDWVGQGYPHYAGSMVYHGQISYEAGQRVQVFLSEWSGTDVAVTVNSALAGHIPWQSANGLDVTAFMKPGENQIDIEVVASPRNMLGPLHRAPQHEPWTDWRSFRRTDESFTPDYVFWPWGLTGQIRVVLT
jgi:hypothetical protein